MEGGGLERRGVGGKVRYVEDEGRGNRKKKRVGVYTECIVRFGTGSGGKRKGGIILSEMPTSQTLPP